MRLKGLGLALLSGLLLTPVLAAAASMEELEARVAELETAATEAVDASERATQVSGYVDTEYSWYQDKDSAPGFRAHHLSLFFQKRLSNDLRFFSEIEWEDGPEFEGATANGKIFLEAVNIDYLYDPRASVRVGRFFTPAGIWSIDHYPPFVATQQRPQHIRKIFPQLIDGAMVYGTIPMGETFLKYDAFLGNGEGNANSAHGDDNNAKGKGLKVSALFPALKYLEVGGTLYQDDLPSGVEKDASGLHAKVKVQDFSIQAEYAKEKKKPLAGSDSEEEGYYIQGLYDYNNWTFGLRTDLYDADSGNSSTKTETTYNSLILNYHVSTTVVLKLEHHEISYNDSTKTDNSQTTASVAMFLGN